ncbi:MAG: LPS export ABC transporter permease LptG [Gammaproteobacteria bacterium 28-57-27]|nr:MAG: LPS export ABC transporter permease LptG [Gammaproteobacteria bacterium 28-57-27]
MRLDLYVLRAVLGGTLATLGVVLALAMILLFLDEVDKISAAYTLFNALMFVLLMLPGYMLEFFPLATLIGSLVALGALAAGNEITAMRSMGLSLARISVPVLMAGVLLGLMGMLIGETLGPWGQSEARLMRAQALGQTLSLQGAEGLWVREKRAELSGGERFVHIDLVTPGGEVRGVRVFDFAANGALQGAMQFAQAKPFEAGWLAEQVGSNQFSAERIESAFESQRRLESLVQPNVLNVLAVIPQYMSLGELWRYAQFLDKNSLKSEAYWLAWWGKLLAPLSVVAMLLLALPFSLATRRAGGAGVRLVIGIVLGMGVFVLSRLLTQGSLLAGLSPMFAAMLPPVMMLAVAIWFLYRQESRHVA